MGQCEKQARIHDCISRVRVGRGSKASLIAWPTVGRRTDRSTDWLIELRVGYQKWYHDLAIFQFYEFMHPSCVMFMHIGIEQLNSTDYLKKSTARAVPRRVPIKYQRLSIHDLDSTWDIVYFMTKFLTVLMEFLLMGPNWNKCLDVLDAFTHLYKRLCPSVGWSVGPLVQW